MDFQVEAALPLRWEGYVVSADNFKSRSQDLGTHIEMNFKPNVVKNYSILVRTQMSKIESHDFSVVRHFLTGTQEYIVADFVSVLYIPDVNHVRHLNLILV